MVAKMDCLYTIFQWVGPARYLEFTLECVGLTKIEKSQLKFTEFVYRKEFDSPCYILWSTNSKPLFHKFIGVSCKVYFTFLFEVIDDVNFEKKVC